MDNEKGLLIDFKIIGCQLGTQAIGPSLTVDFGDVLPGQVSIARWLLTCSLQGLFINYRATFEHVDPLGNPRLSLIDGVEIHEMNHMVQAPGAWDDGQPDFLVNDIPDFNNLPDTLYLSDGSIQPVSVVQAASLDSPASASHLAIQLTANFPAGFTYVQVPESANGQFQLQTVFDSTGANLLSNNFWTTDRTFLGLGQRPIDENVLHLFDYHTNAGAYTYTLIYAAPGTASRTNPPVSSVFALPPLSPTVFGVVWSGANDVGQAPLAYYDIFVSDDGGPFTLWQAQTTATGALYTGLAGHTYAFYSRATDTAGNVESPPGSPEATTTVGFVDNPPAISFATNFLTVNAGATVSFTPIVIDTNSLALSFSLGIGAPSGASIDPVGGTVTWPTSPSDGPSTN